MTKICCRTWLSHTKLLHWSGLMSESQQGPEICDVISRRRYYNSVCLIHLLSGWQTTYQRQVSSPLVFHHTALCTWFHLLWLLIFWDFGHFWAVFQRFFSKFQAHVSFIFLSYLQHWACNPSCHFLIDGH